MNKKAFSLAEALITLLVVCIVAIATVPLITKKKRPVQSERQTLWNVERIMKSAIYPAASRDIMLGEINPKKSQGIIIAGTLEFKDRSGNTIGWIKEDGSSSFEEKFEMQLQNGVETIKAELQNELQNASDEITADFLRKNLGIIQYGGSSEENGNYGDVSKVGGTHEEIRNKINARRDRLKNRSHEDIRNDIGARRDKLRNR